MYLNANAYIPIMPPGIPPAGDGDSFSGNSATNAPMVIAVPAIDTAFWIASLVTRAGSTIPLDFISTNFAGLLTSTPCPFLADLTFGSHSSAFRPALDNNILNGSNGYQRLN